MSSEKSLDEMFKQWNDINISVQKAMGEFDYPSVKSVRETQRNLEDKIYEIVLQNAPESIKEIIEEDCDSMEMGFEMEKSKFYFLMYDPNEEDQLMAITINSKKEVELIKNFKRD